MLIFREINNIYAGLEHIKRKEFRRMSNKFLFRPDPLKRIKDEILFMAEQKQNEIDELRRLPTDLAAMLTETGITGMPAA